MKKSILHAAVLATSALAFTGIAQAGGVAVDNNIDGVAQYTTFDKDKKCCKDKKMSKHEKMSKGKKMSKYEKIEDI